MTTVAGLLIQALLLALAVLLCIALLTGLAVAIRPELLDRFQRTSDQRFSMRRATRSLDIPRNIDRWFYRHHRLYGAAVVVLAAAVLSFLAFGQSQAAWRSLFPAEWRGVGEILIDTARVVLWILGLFSLAVGTVVFVRPSALKSVESRANRWLTPRRALRGLEREVHGPEDWVRRHPRRWGVAIALVSAICLLALILQSGSILRLAG